VCLFMSMSLCVCSTCTHQREQPSYSTLIFIFFNQKSIYDIGKMYRSPLDFKAVPISKMLFHKFILEITNQGISLSPFLPIYLFERTASYIKDCIQFPLEEALEIFYINVP